MAEKLVIQQFSQSDLVQFLHENGFGDFAETLISWDVNDGEKFLNLNEFQMLKWNLQAGTKKKFVAFLMEVQKNPEKFISPNDKRINTISRRQSFVRSNPKRNDFKEKLEHVIIAPKPADFSQLKKAPAVLPKPDIETQPSSPLNEYLPMDKPKEDFGSHYDANGYLKPIERSEQFFEENDYEPPPSNKVIVGFASTPPLSQRPPLTLPRSSTDDRGYISGPRGLDEEPPKSSDSSGTLNFNTLNISAPPLPPRRNEIKDADDEEMVDYEPVDDDDSSIASSTLTINEPENPDMNSGTIARLFERFKKNKKIEAPNVEPKQVEPVRKLPKDQLLRAHTPEQIKSRPLPALPQLLQEQEEMTRSLGRRHKQPEPLEEYENVRKRNLSISGYSNQMNVLHSLDVVKSKSENNLATEEPSMTYENLEDKRKAKPGSYEKYCPTPSNTGRRPLPLPPKSLPQIKPVPLPPDDDEPEEYGKVIYNINDEPFYRYTDRKGARLLLSGLDDGAFLFRPSKQFFLTLSLKYDGRYFNLGIEKTGNNKLRLKTEGNDMSPEFATPTDLVEYFTRERLTFQHKGQVIELYLAKILPSDRF